MLAPWDDPQEIQKTGETALRVPIRAAGTTPSEIEDGFPDAHSSAVFFASGVATTTAGVALKRAVGTNNVGIAAQKASYTRCVAPP